MKKVLLLVLLLITLVSFSQRGLKVYFIAHSISTRVEGKMVIRKNGWSIVENLREATNQQNQFNVGLLGRNKSGVKNVVWNRCKWKVYMRINSKTKNLGAFEDLELAELVAIEARNKFHGEFVNHG